MAWNGTERNRVPISRSIRMCVCGIYALNRLKKKKTVAFCGRYQTVVGIIFHLVEVLVIEARFERCDPILYPYGNQAEVSQCAFYLGGKRNEFKRVKSETVKCIQKHDIGTITLARRCRIAIWLPSTVAVAAQSNYSLECCERFCLAR